MLAIRGVQKRFGAFQALRGVSLDVAAGEVLCVIGASGSGKTTLLRCVNQLVAIDAGAIWLGGVLLGRRIAAGRLYPLSEAEVARQRRRTGIVFQRFNLFPHLTALGNMTEGPVQVLRRQPAAAAREAMALLGRVGLASKAHAYPAQLSGGQQQRVAIARAIALRAGA